MLLQQAEKKIFGLLSICIIGSDVLNRENSFGAADIPATWKENLGVRRVLERIQNGPCASRPGVLLWKGSSAKPEVNGENVCSAGLREGILYSPYLLQNSRCNGVILFFPVYIWYCYLFNSFLCCTFSSHLHEFSNFRRGFFWKALIIIKWIDLYVALVITFKRMQEGLRKDFQKSRLTLWYRHWMMTYALPKKSVCNTIKSILLHVVHKTININNLTSKL